MTRNLVSCRGLQMIMGAGKTSVISPLLALMLADGRSLVLQVCPRPLLPQTLRVMRRVFSSILRKRLFALRFDRSAAARVVRATEPNARSLQLTLKE